MADNDISTFDIIINWFKNNWFIAVILVGILVFNRVVQLAKDVNDFNNVLSYQKTDKNILKIISIGTRVDFAIDKIGKPNKIESNGKNSTIMTWDLEDIIISTIVKDSKLIQVEYKIPPSSKSIFSLFRPDGDIHPKEYLENGEIIEYEPLGKLTYRDVIDNIHCFYARTYGSQGPYVEIKMKLDSYEARPYKQKEEYIIIPDRDIMPRDDLDKKINKLIIRYSKDGMFGVTTGDQEDDWEVFNTEKGLEEFIERVNKEYE
jgi:hypothetical protein